MLALCVVFFIFFKGGIFFKNNFILGGRKYTLLQALVRGLACSGLQECIFCVRAFHIASFLSKLSSVFINSLIG